MLDLGGRSFVPFVAAVDEEARSMSCDRHENVASLQQYYVQAPPTIEDPNTLAEGGGISIEFRYQPPVI